MQCSPRYSIKHHGKQENLKYHLVFQNCSITSKTKSIRKPIRITPHSRNIASHYPDAINALGRTLIHVTCLYENVHHPIYNTYLVQNILPVILKNLNLDLFPWRKTNVKTVKLSWINKFSNEIDNTHFKKLWIWTIMEI